ncbi:hypothetical protein JCM19992_08590 [Thermostilla marina]
MRRAFATSSRERKWGRHDVVAGRPLLLWLSLAGLVPFFVLGAMAECPNDKTPAPLPPIAAEPLPPLPPVDHDVGEAFISDVAEAPEGEKELRVLPAPPSHKVEAQSGGTPAARLAITVGESENAPSEPTAWQVPENLDRSPVEKVLSTSNDHTTLGVELLPAQPAAPVGGEWVPAGTNRSDDRVPSNPPPERPLENRWGNPTVPPPMAPDRGSEAANEKESSSENDPAPLASQDIPSGDSPLSEPTKETVDLSVGRVVESKEADAVPSEPPLPQNLAADVTAGSVPSEMIVEEVDAGVMPDEGFTAVPSPSDRDVVMQVVPAGPAPETTYVEPEAAPMTPELEVIDESGELTVIVRRSKLLRTKVDIYRTAVVDPSICDVAHYTTREVAILGKSQGATHVTFWFADEKYRPVTYLVRVVPDPEIQLQQEERYRLLESHLRRLFPESKVTLTAVGDKLVVRGQARDAAEAAQIMAIIRGEVVSARGVAEGTAADPVGNEATNQTLPALQVINMLRIPGPAQVALKVKIAELNRSAARNFGVDMDMNFSQGEVLLQSLLNLASGGTASILGNFDGGDIQFGIHYLEEHGVVRLLSEPTLVTLSGRPATFIAGGEFAVPTAVGVNGVGAVTTDFRAYGAIITFLPTVLDKDHIRLEVAPEFSQIDDENTVNGTPGLKTRAVTTTVEMREGQTLAIAGLLDDAMSGDNAGDLPFVAQIFGRRSISRRETELIILVTPELVEPMEPEEVPPVPGFDVTEPTNHEFYLKGHIEGRPTQEYDSTVWPRLRRRYNAGGPAQISGPYGHGD